jgi:hypothetical protein
MSHQHLAEVFYSGTVLASQIWEGDKGSLLC